MMASDNPACCAASTSFSFSDLSTAVAAMIPSAMLFSAAFLAMAPADATARDDVFASLTT